MANTGARLRALRKPDDSDGLAELIRQSGSVSVPADADARHAAALLALPILRSRAVSDADAAAWLASWRLRNPRTYADADAAVSARVAASTAERERLAGLRSR